MTSAKQYEAACSCGRLRIKLEGEPQIVSSCHCLACQRRTGALFGSNAFFARSQQVAVEGESRTWSRLGESGATLTFRFCPNCGSTVFWENQGLPDMICVAIGAFADPSFAPPVRTVWTVNKHAWLAFPPDIVHHPHDPT